MGPQCTQRAERTLRALFGLALAGRLLYPFFNSPLAHLFSDPLRHWNNAARFLSPDLIGAGDPYLYQLWLYLVRLASGDDPAWVQLSCGILCAAMPYGWYRALGERLPRAEALGGALLIALVPSWLGIYAYFMTETLLLTLTGYAFWLTLRAWRKATLGAWVLCCAVWVAAVFTRLVALPLALACLGPLWLAQPARLPRALVATAIFAVLAIPAGLHARAVLHFWAPLGNPYITQIYNLSGRHDIALDAGTSGQYGFGSPSFYNPTFTPFSRWTTAREGVATVHLDLSRGRETWLVERERLAARSPLGAFRRFAENLLYTLFGPSWPDNDPASRVGRASVATRWLWVPLMLFVGWGLVRGYCRGRDALLPACALGMVVFFIVQTTAIMEGRYRKPIEPILVAAAVVLVSRMRQAPARPGAVSACPG